MGVESRTGLYTASDPVVVMGEMADLYDAVAVTDSGWKGAVTAFRLLNMVILINQLAINSKRRFHNKGSTVTVIRGGAP